MKLGEVGHLFVIASFVVLLGSMMSYALGIKGNDHTSWLRLANRLFFVHVLTVIGVLVSLFVIIYGHHFEYHYAWSHSSRELPLHFVISSFWEGQEGSFLLWIFWNSVLGLILIKRLKFLRSSTLLIFSLIQAFLVSMVLGIHIPVLGLKLGSSAFALLRHVIESPLFLQNPDFVPNDGTGLNPLLQNIWMVIHPPIIFLGFALAAVPFSIGMAALIERQYVVWTKISLPWVGLTVLILGLGIMMGAYWAYETLNFGGYWSWDPVENAIYIPWLVSVAALHTLVINKKKGNQQLSSLILTSATFVLIVYSTFLTRSGILGNSSVHSFTDLGLSGQLLTFVILSVFSSVGLLILRRHDLKRVESDFIWNNPESWMTLGSIVLCLAAFQVLIPTSIPVWNALIEIFGSESNLAPPVDPLTFYTPFQGWFAVAILLAISFGQIFYLFKIETRKEVESKLWFSVSCALVMAAILVLLGKWTDPLSISLTLSLCISSVFSVVWIIRGAQFRQGSPLLNMGGSWSHFGFAILILGLLYSAGKSQVISQNGSLDFTENDLSENIKTENVLLIRDEPSVMNGYLVHYLGSCYFSRDHGYILKNQLFKTSDPKKFVSKVKINGSIGSVEEGDTIHVRPENTYYKIILADKGGKAFTIYPRMQNNEKMGYMASPGITKYWNRDVYAHISNFPDESKQEWSEVTKLSSLQNDTAWYGDLGFIFRGIKEINQSPGFRLNENDHLFEASFEIVYGLRSYTVKPLIAHISGQTRLYPDHNEALGIKLWTTQVSNKNDALFSTFNISTSQKDWITLKAIVFPHINWVWIGTIIMCLGTGLSVWKRFAENTVYDGLMAVEKNVREHLSKKESQTSKKVIINGLSDCKTVLN